MHQGGGATHEKLSLPMGGWGGDTGLWAQEEGILVSGCEAAPDEHVNNKINKIG